MASTRKPDPLKDRISSLPDMPPGQSVSHKPAVPPTFPGLRLGIGKQPIPPKTPERIPLAVESSPAATQVIGMLQPAPGSHVPPPVLATDKNFPPPISEPKRSLSPPPESTAFQVRSGDVDFRLSKGTWSRLRPYALWLALPLGGLLLGYYQGLKAAAARMRAAEARTAALTGELADLRATHDTKLNSHARALARDGVVADDHEERLKRAETRVEILGERVSDLSKQKAIIVKPSN